MSYVQMDYYFFRVLMYFTCGTTLLVEWASDLNRYMTLKLNHLDETQALCGEARVDHLTNWSRWYQSLEFTVIMDIMNKRCVCMVQVTVSLIIYSQQQPVQMKINASKSTVDDTWQSDLQHKQVL